MANEFQRHSVYLHSERNGYTLRYYEGPVRPENRPVRLVFSNAHDLFDFLIVNWLPSEEVKDDSNDHWLIRKNPNRISVGKAEEAG